MSQYFPKYRKSKRLPYSPPQDPRFYRVFDVWLKIAISIAIIIISFLIVRPDFNDMLGYLTWVIATESFGGRSVVWCWRSSRGSREAGVVAADVFAEDAATCPALVKKEMERNRLTTLHLVIF